MSQNPYKSPHEQSKTTNANIASNEVHLPPKRVLTRFDCVCIIVGTIIGAGIFKIPAIVSGKMPDVYWLAGVWIFGGAIALIGALCFAELTTTYPDRGGDYGYLKRAYHPRFGFAFSWTAFWVIRPGNIGAMAMVFGKFANQAFPNSLSEFLYAVIGVVTITITNLLGIKVGKTALNILTVAKVLGIMLIVVSAFVFGSRQSESKVAPETSAASVIAATSTGVANTAVPKTDPQESESPLTDGRFWLALMFVMFAFGGWNDIAFMASEAKEPKKNLLPSLVIGTGTVLFVYLLINCALVYGFGFENMAARGQQYESATAAMINNNMGETGNRIFSLVVCVSCLGAINAMILTSPRIYWATAIDYPSLQWLAGSGKERGWWRAMMLQAVVTLLLIGMLGNSKGGFENIVAATAPYFWLFLAATIVSLVVNRIRYKGQFDGFRIPFGPLFPIIFVLTCVFMAYMALDYMVVQKLQVPTAGIGGWVIVGATLSFFLKSSISKEVKS